MSNALVRRSLPRTQANYESLIALVQRMLELTAGSDNKRMRRLHREIRDWKLPDSSEVISPHTHSSKAPEVLNPAPALKKAPGALKRKGPPKPQVSRGGILLPGDPTYEATLAGREPTSPVSH